MKIKSSFRDLYAIIALVISCSVCAGIIFLLWQKEITTADFNDTLNSMSIIFISISGALSAIFMFFIVNLIMSLKNTKTQAIEQLSQITQKMHNFRAIADLLFHSNIWLPGLSEHIEKEYTDLTFFEVKEFYKGKSKTAIDFLQEAHHFGDTENSYLELKSLLMTSPKEKHLPENVSYPPYYNTDLVEKWAKHKVGTGLWYVFGYKYGTYKDSINLDAVYERNQEKMLTLANAIDDQAFEDSSFNEIFLAKLWEYMAKDVIPRLQQFQGQMVKKIPGFARYLYVTFLIFVIFGILLPLSHLLLGYAPVVLIVGYAIVLSTIFYVAITFQLFLSKEMGQ